MAPPVSRCTGSLTWLTAKSRFIPIQALIGYASRTDFASGHQVPVVIDGMKSRPDRVVRRHPAGERLGALPGPINAVWSESPACK